MNNKKKIASKVVALSLACGFSLTGMAKAFAANSSSFNVLSPLGASLDVTNMDRSAEAYLGMQKDVPEYRTGLIPNFSKVDTISSQYDVIDNKRVTAGASATDSKFDPRKNPNTPTTTSDRVSPVKNQGKSGLCWAFGIMSSIESDVMINAKKTPDYSEVHMGNNVNTETSPNTGGNYNQGLAYLGRLNGPLDESVMPSAKDLPNSTGWVDASGNPVPAGTSGALKDPYYTGGAIAADGMSSDVTVPGHKPLDDVASRLSKGDLTFRLKQMNVVSPNKDSIKDAIVKHGSVFASYWVEQKVVPSGGGGFIDYNFDKYDFDAKNKTNSINHAISIVGWDDDMVIGNQKGAWLIKNSWDTMQLDGKNPYGEYGYQWLTYRSFDYDVSDFVTFAGETKDIKDIKAQYHDDFWGTFLTYKVPDDKPIVADTFEKATNDNETITEIGYTGFISNPVDYDIYITQNEDYKTTNDRSKWGKLVKSGTRSVSGFEMVDLDSKFNVKGPKGSKFTVIYEFKGKINTPIVAAKTPYTRKSDGSLDEIKHDGDHLRFDAASNTFKKDSDRPGGSTIKVITKDVKGDVTEDEKDTEKPVITVTNDGQTVKNGETIKDIEVKVTDNKGVDKVKVELPAGLDGITYDKDKGAITGKAEVKDFKDSEESREFTITIKASDKAGNEETKIVKITVTNPNYKKPGKDDDKKDEPLVIEADIENQEIKNGEDIKPVVIKTKGSSKDVTVKVDIPEGIEGLSFDPSTGSLSGKITINDFKDSEEKRDVIVKVTATDKDGKSVSENITITVTNPNYKKDGGGNGDDHKPDDNTPDDNKPDNGDDDNPDHGDNPDNNDDNKPDDTNPDNKPDHEDHGDDNTPDDKKPDKDDGEDTKPNGDDKSDDKEKSSSLLLKGTEKAIKVGDSRKLYAFFKETQKESIKSNMVTLSLLKANMGDEKKDKYEELYADVLKDGYKLVEDEKLVWTLEGNKSKDTKIDQKGILSVGKDESVKKLRVTVALKDNPKLKASSDIEVVSGKKNAEKTSKSKGISQLSDGQTIIVNKDKADEINIDNSDITEVVSSRKPAMAKKKMEKPMDKPMQKTGVTNITSNVDGVSGVFAMVFMFVANLFRKKR